MTPRVALLAYDADVYRTIGRDGGLDVRNEADVNRLNELQVIRASEALFFSDNKDEEYVRRIFNAYNSGRRKEWSITWTAIRDGEDGEYERYRKIRPGDHDSMEPRIQSVSPIIPTPTTWPSFIKFKLRPRGWTNGSVVGFVRAAHQSRGTSFRRVTLPSRLPRNQAPAHRDVIYQRKVAPK